MRLSNALVLILASTSPLLIHAAPAPVPGGKIKDAAKTAAEYVLEKFFGMGSQELSNILTCFAKRGKKEVEKIKSSVTCGACTKAVTIFESALDHPEVISAIGSWACRTLKVFEPASICEGIIPQFVPWLKEVLQDPSFNDPERRQFCHNLADLCPSNPTGFLPSLPARSASKPAAGVLAGGSQVEDVKYVVHISDFHLDVDYTEGAEGACKAFLCCRKDSTDGTNVIKEPCGKFGAYLSDTPVALAKSAMAAITKLVPKIDMVLITGDLVPHNLWETTKDKVFKELDAAVTIIREGLPANTTVIPAIGNHDTSPSNYFAPSTLPGYSRVPKGTQYAPAIDTYGKLA
ncbi:hypothetical protein HDU67_000821, partial [Dinochytrium kinnereticum]